MSTLEDLYIHFDGVEDLDFIPVVDVDLSESYEWDEFHAWYSPSRRTYFWGSRSGCSCNTFGDYFYSLDDFENSRSREDVVQALRRYFNGQYRNHSAARQAALRTVAAFRPSGLESH